MRRRQRHRLDMLPLLDVFMVVLFVFASIQEKDLDESRTETARLRAELELERGRERTNDHAAELAAARAQLERAKATAEQDARALRGALDELREDAAAAARRASPSRDDALRRQEVLAKLLDHFSVFEIEIAGQIDSGGGVANRCCFRTDPYSSQWSPCGVVPHRTPEMAEWLEGGANGLLDALRNTKGGNAMTIIRQDETATFRIASAVESNLRERFADHEFYNEGLSLEASLCSTAGSALHRDR